MPEVNILSFMKYLVFPVLGIGLMMACTGKESNKIESFKNDTSFQLDSSKNSFDALHAISSFL
jgi:hypothetical protein